MVQWESVKVTNPSTGQTEIVNIQTGLSPGQTSGTINEQYFERPTGISTRETYYPPPRLGSAATPRSFMTREVAQRNIEREVAARRQQAGYVESSMDKLRQRFETTEEPMFIAKGRLLQQQKKSTPIQKQTPAAYGLYSKPLYDYSARLSQGLQEKYSLEIEKTKIPRPAKQFLKGAGTVVTGLPEFFGSGAAGIEYGARHPQEVKEKFVPAVKKYVVDFAGVAIKDPFYATGQLAGVLALGKASKIRASSLMKDTSGSLSLMPRPKPFPRQIPQLQLKKRPAYTHEIYYEEPIIKSRVGERILNNIRDYAVTRKPILTTIAGSRYKYGVGIFTPQRIGLGQGSSVRATPRQAMFQGLSIGQKPKIRHGDIYKTAYGTGILSSTRVDLKQVTPQLTKLKSIQDVLTVQKTKVREPLFRLPKPIKLKMPEIEMPVIFGRGKRRKQEIKSKTVRTKMLSLADLFGR